MLKYLMLRSRNNLVELFRFLFSILVVGYHIQMTFLGDSTNFFENVKKG